MSQNARQGEVISSQRRRLLRTLALTSMAPALMLGCSGSTPPREYQRPRTHIVGGNGKRGRSREGM
jgi:hypothetical protein